MVLSQKPLLTQVVQQPLLENLFVVPLGQWRATVVENTVLTWLYIFLRSHIVGPWMMQGRDS